MEIKEVIDSVNKKYIKKLLDVRWGIKIELISNWFQK